MSTPSNPQTRVIGALALAAMLLLMDGSPPIAATVAPQLDVRQAGLIVQLIPALGSFTHPVFLTHANDGSNRRFVVEQRGVIKVAVGDQVQATPFLDIQARVLAMGESGAGLEQGLLGLAFHPSYRTNGTFFVYYTAEPGGANTLARYQVSANPNVANTAETVLFSFADRAVNHNGATILFGPDGFLYVSIGDEGLSGDAFENAQNPAVPFGKILRLDVNRAENGKNYAIPPSNPFVGQAGVLPEIWALGLRHPYRVSFDRLTGDLYIADVGDLGFEEVNVQPRASSGGQNYGWSCREGLHPFVDGSPDPRCTPTPSGLTDPVTEYSRAENVAGPGEFGCAAITGGYVHRGPSAGPLAGAYIFGDYCTGLIWRLRRDRRLGWQKQLILDTTVRISSFGEDEQGELYVLHHSAGQVLKLVATGSTAPAPGERGGQPPPGAPAPRPSSR